MSEIEPEYESAVIAELTVDLPDGGTSTAKDVRVRLLPGGALLVCRSRRFSDAVPFEEMFPHGAWTKYHAYPKG